MLINSQQMHVAFTTSKSVAVSHLRILAPAHSPNTDGIHISSSSRVIIKSSTISTGMFFFELNLQKIQCFFYFLCFLPN